MATTTIWILALILAFAGLWDAYVLYRWGISSGKTASWEAYQNSRHWPIVGFLVGMLSFWAMWVTGTHPVIATWFFICGHVLFVMRTDSARA